jgi:hypothetical protein
LQRLSAAGTFSAVPSAADGSGASQRLNGSALNIKLRGGNDT